MKISFKLISIIMSVYNEKEEWIKNSIDSILNQTFTNIEFIIIIDNPNNDIAIELIKEYVKKDKRIKYFINEENKGLIYSLNRALKYAKGDYIARMDADDISHKDRLKKQLNYLYDKDLDLIGSNVNLFNENGIFYTTDKLLTHKYIVKLLKAGTIGIVHPTFFAKRDVFTRLNGYKNALYAEDMEFLSRVICNNFKVGNIPDILLDCRYNNQSITKNNAYVMYKTSEYITNIFNYCIKSKYYNFDENYLEKINILEKEIMNFNKKQITLSKARKELNSKKYISFFINILKAFYYSPNSVISSIKINLILKVLKKIENIERGSKK